MNKTNRDFRAGVLLVVTKIPRGRVLTYAQVAKLAGRPRAWRVVGNILHQNYDPHIPCHRVVRANGDVGGYNRGARGKIALLRREGVKFISPSKVKLPHGKFV